MNKNVGPTYKSRSLREYNQLRVSNAQNKKHALDLARIVTNTTWQAPYVPVNTYRTLERIADCTPKSADHFRKAESGLETKNNVQ